MRKQRALDRRINLATKISDINRLVEKGCSEAATMFVANVFLELGDVGNYFRQNNETPTEIDWLLIDPAFDYLRGKNWGSMKNSYFEASLGILFLKNLKEKSANSI